MFKKIKLGLSAMVAFAMMFATSVSVVAQEQANTPTAKVEVKESVKARVLTEMVGKTNKKTPKSTVISKSGVYHFPTAANPADWQQAGAYEDGEPGTNCPGGSIPCRIDLTDYDGSLQEFLSSFEEVEDMKQDDRVTWRN